MKPLTDLRTFHWTPLPPPSYFRGMETYHLQSRESFRMLPIDVGGGVDDLLASECVCEVRWKRGARYRRRHAPFLSVEYVLDGELLVRQEGRGYSLEAGDLFLMQPELESELYCAGPGCHKISVMVVGEMLGIFLRESGLDRIDVLAHLDRPHTERLLRQLEDLAESGDNPSPARNALYTYELLQHLRTPPGGPELPEALSRLRADLEEGLDHDWTQAGMAARCGCTPTHLGRLFRKYFDQTPYQMLMEFRIARARHLLARGELSVKEISRRVGYANPLNFSTEFRKRVGVSPREYRQSISRLH